jgi:thiol-disulfide isomerase/thioredoxin
MKPYDDVANSSEDVNNYAQIYFFYADWCPYCKKAHPEWIKFKVSTDQKIINGYLLECVEVDCTEDNGNVTSDHFDKLNVSTSDLITKFNINSYPTVKLVKDGVTIDFDSKVTEASLKQFVESML